MRITSTITLTDLSAQEQEHIILLFTQEDKTLDNNRATYSIQEEQGTLTFQISAQDGVALRAVLTSISKTLAIYHKTKDLIVDA